MTPRLPRQVVTEITDAIKSTERRRHEDGKRPMIDTASIYRDQGLTPYRFRLDLRRAVLPQAWLSELGDRFPALTDAQIDTAMRTAVAESLPLGELREWATSQPLRRS